MAVTAFACLRCFSPPLLLCFVLRLHPHLHLKTCPGPMADAREGGVRRSARLALLSSAAPVPGNQAPAPAFDPTQAAQLGKGGELGVGPALALAPQLAVSEPARALPLTLNGFVRRARRRALPTPLTELPDHVADLVWDQLTILDRVRASCV